MAKVGKRIRKCRERLGYSQEYMASQLEITQSSYAKLENEQVKLSVGRIKQIAQLLETSVHELLNDKTENTFSIFDNEYAVGQKIVENMYVTNKELYEKIIKDKDDEIAFLRKQLDK